MKYKVGDRVKIKSLDWYNKNKTIHGDIWLDNAVFVGGQSLYCGCELTIRLITNDSYYVIENDYYWTDEMIEGIVEEETKSEPKFKVGDKVRIKSLDWYNENKDKNGDVPCEEWDFVSQMSEFCGKILTIDVDFEDGTYLMKEDTHGFVFTNKMIEGLVEEEIKPKFKVGDKITNGEITFTILRLSSDRYGTEDTFGECGSVCFKSQDDWKIVEENFIDIDKFQDDNEVNDIVDEYVHRLENNECQIDLPEGYQFTDEDGNIINTTKIVLEKKKKEYPKTYEECLKILNAGDDVCICVSVPLNYTNLLITLTKLLICRDAYWKIAGEEMGLGKPWKPDWINQKLPKYCIAGVEGRTKIAERYIVNTILVFPSAEMRDAFYENFKDLIEECKELL